jgi:aminopeptidase-like protein
MNLTKKELPLVILTGHRKSGTSVFHRLFDVVIDSELKHGVLNYGELIIKGETDKEVLLSTYVCHPSMANNELSRMNVLSPFNQKKFNIFVHCQKNEIL